MDVTGCLFKILIHKYVSHFSLKDTPGTMFGFLSNHADTLITMAIINPCLPRQYWNTWLLLHEKCLIDGFATMQFFHKIFIMKISRTHRNLGQRLLFTKHLILGYRFFKMKRLFDHFYDEHEKWKFTAIFVGSFDEAFWKYSWATSNLPSVIANRPLSTNSWKSGDEIFPLVNFKIFIENELNWLIKLEIP